MHYSVFNTCSAGIIDSGLSAQQPKNDKLFAAQTTGRRSIIVEDDFSQPAETLVSTDGGSKCC